MHLAGSIGQAQRPAAKLKGIVPASRLTEYTDRVISDFKTHKARARASWSTPTAWARAALCPTPS